MAESCGQGWGASRTSTDEERGLRTLGVVWLCRHLTSLRLIHKRVINGNKNSTQQGSSENSRDPALSQKPRTLLVTKEAHDFMCIDLAIHVLQILTYLS